MFTKLNQTRLPERTMLAMMLMATVAFTFIFLELASSTPSGWLIGFPSPALDMHFLAALICACGFVGWMYAADLHLSLLGRKAFEDGKE